MVNTLLLGLALLRSPGSEEVTGPKDLLLVRRPEEARLLPPYDGRAPDLPTLAAKARVAGYAERRIGDALVLFSPGVLPIALWKEEAAARRNIVAGIAPDGTMTVRADSEEGRFLLASLTVDEEFGEQFTTRLFPDVQITLESGGKRADFTLGAPLKARPKIPLTVARKREGERAKPLPLYASAQAMRSEYVFKSAGATMFAPSATLGRRRAALATIEEIAKEYLEREASDGRLLYDALAPLALDDRRIPARGTSYDQLPNEVRDEIEYVLRSDPKRYGFSDAQDAAKWLAGAGVSGARASVGMGVETERGGVALMLASRRY